MTLHNFNQIPQGRHVDLLHLIRKISFQFKVVSLDEENGRVLVDIPLKKESVSLSEFMMIAVTKSEYDRESKVISKW